MSALNFFQNEVEADLKLVRAFNVHGARFVEIGFSLSEDPPETMRRARVSDNLIYPDPQPGDRVKIAMLMGNVSRVVKIGN